MLLSVILCTTMNVDNRENLRKFCVCDEIVFHFSSCLGDIASDPTSQFMQSIFQCHVLPSLSAFLLTFRFEAEKAPVFLRKTI